MTTFLFYEDLYFGLESRENTNTRRFYGRMLERAVKYSDNRWYWANYIWNEL